MMEKAGIDVLQRGRAFWGAEIFRYVGRPPCTHALQRGRAFWGAEICEWEVHSLGIPDASTGPRLLGRGDY